MKMDIKKNISDRNYGIDLLRIIAMIMIPVLHVLGHGGVLEATKGLTLKGEMAWFLEIAMYCATDIYGLISGYVGYGREQKFSNLVYLSFQVVFYTVFITMLFCIFKPQVISIRTLYEAPFPIMYNTYWYFTAYFCLFFFMPFLNKILENFEEYTMRKLLISTFIVFSFLPAFLGKDIARTMNGYSFLWLAVLYIVGGYIKKYGYTFKRNNKTYLLTYLFGVVFVWILRFIGQILNEKIFGIEKIVLQERVVNYTSPLIIVCAVTLVLLFKEINCGSKLIKFIRFFAPLSFGVYLFHEEPLIKNNFIEDHFEIYATYNPLLMIFCVIATAIIIWFLGSLVDMIRLKIFDYLEIKRLCLWIERKISKII